MKQMRQFSKLFAKIQILGRWSYTFQRDRILVKMKRSACLLHVSKPKGLLVSPI